MKKINQMNERGSVNVVLIIIIVLLVGALSYVAVFKGIQKSEQATQSNVSQNTEIATSTTTSTTQSTATPSSPSLPLTCVDEFNGVGGSDLDPVITSITPTSGKAGTKVQIRGCNLAGFEGDHLAVFERPDGKKIWLTGAGYNEKEMIVTLETYCPKGVTMGSYSGIVSECERVDVIPGIYKVYVYTWGEKSKSNIATFTVVK